MKKEITSIHITGNQAIKLLRAARAMQVVTAVPCNSVRALTSPNGVDSLGDLGIDRLLSWLNIGPKNPLRILVPNEESRSWITGVQTSVLSRDVPSGSFMELKDGLGKGAILLPSSVRVFVDAPPMALVSAAQQSRQLLQGGSGLRLNASPASHLYDSKGLSVRAQATEIGSSEPSLGDLEMTLRLMALASEFCGSYARDPQRPQKDACHYDDPKNRDQHRFVSLEELSSVLADMPPIGGLSLARKAAKYAADESGSPMETLAYLAWTLPPRLAGLSLRKPLMNKQLVVEDEAVKKMVAEESLRPDFQWPEYLTLAEYLGDKEHADHDSRVRDKNRLQRYVAADYSPLFLMFDDVNSVRAINDTALKLAREFQKHGKRREVFRIQRILRDEEFAARQRRLMKTLLPPLLRYSEV